jgi:hypothetical protein
MWYREGDSFSNFRVIQQGLFYLSRRDFFSTTVDDFLDPACDMKISLRVEISLISRPKPAVPESCQIGYGLVLVPPRNIIPADDNLSSRSCGERVAHLRP